MRIRNLESRSELTYKGPRKKTDAGKVRKEIEASMPRTSVRNMQDILFALGYTAKIYVNKERSFYVNNDAHPKITVTLDEVKDLGTYFELEMMVSEDDAEAIKRIQNLANKIGLVEEERRSYLELLIKG